MRYRVPFCILAVVAAVGGSGPASAQAAFPGANGKISFSSLSAGSGDLFAALPDGTGAWQRLTSDPADDAQSAWSPDGSRIVL